MHETNPRRLLHAEKVIISRVQRLAIVLKLHPIPIFFAKRQMGSLGCMWGVQSHSGPPVFLKINGMLRKVAERSRVLKILQFPYSC